VVDSGRGTYAFAGVDNVTHGLAGLLVADAAVHWLERRGVTVAPRQRRTLSVLGVVAAEFPDSDLLYSGPLLDMGPLGYLLHHRGHTHTLVWAVVSALLLWLVARWYAGRDGALVPARLPRVLLLVALTGTWSHILLDWTNSYGVHPFWPLNGRWYYGDAVFIVEPWLWLVAIPPLYWNRPGALGRSVLVFCFVAILAAVLLLGQVAAEVVAVLLVFAVLWPLVQWRLRAPTRTWSGMGTWALITVAFFAASRTAEASVREAVAASGVGSGGEAVVLDVVLTPGPGDWGCWSALVMSRSPDAYTVSSAFVAPFPTARSLARCTAGSRTGRVGGDVLSGLRAHRAPVFLPSAKVAWRSSWSTPLPSLAALARSRCEVDAALYFMRAPVWQSLDNGRLLLSDARFGVGGGGFSEIELPPAGACTLRAPWIPGWVPPRAELLR
jgi:inner membrane protein